MLQVLANLITNAIKNDQRGLGLGLYISRCIIEAHGGKIWAESTMGEGSVFRLTIPAAVADRSAVTDAPPDPAPSLPQS